MNPTIIADHDAEMGFDHDRGKGRGLAQAAMAQHFAPGEEILEIETTKITNVLEMPRGRHVAARSWRRTAPPCRSARCSR